MKSPLVRFLFLAAVLFSLLDYAKPVKSRYLPEVHQHDIPGSEERELEGKYFVAVCGIELKSVLSLPRFFLYAVPALLGANVAKGNVRAWYRPFAGFRVTQHRTLSVWNSEQDMLNWLSRGAHTRAADMIPKIAVYAGKYDFESDTKRVNFRDVLDDWDDMNVPVYEEGNGARRHV